MKMMYEAGCNFFDTAEQYGEGAAEMVMGRAFKELGWARKDFVCSTKLFWANVGGKN